MYPSKKSVKADAKWKILMVDDEPEVHRAARLVLSDFEYKGIGLDLIEVGSAMAAKGVIEKEKNIALILLDVFMETPHAGLNFIGYVRGVLKNKIVQIVLKTGHAGKFPEKDIVAKYDINNFFSKTELTSDKMTTMVTSALRGYELASSLKKVNKRLEKELEKNKLSQLALKKFASEVRRLNQLQLNIINSTDIWLHVKNHEGAVILWNKAAESISGYEKHEVKGKKDIWNCLIPCSDERSRLLKEEKLVALSDKEPCVFETQIKDKSGNEKTLSWHLRPLKGSDGEIHGLSCLGVDITEKKNLEKKFLHSQKMEAVGRLAGGVAHDFNNTLTVIRGYCELLQLKIGENEGLIKNVTQIDLAAEKAEILTRQLLAFSRHQLVKTEVFDLNELIINMEDMLKRLANENIVIRLNLAKGQLFIKTNQGKVEQALMNLVVNAVDAIDGSGEIFISTKIAKPYKTENILLVVRDNGKGIPLEIQAQVFDPFFTTKSKDKGTGLGLSTVYGIMKQCGGNAFIKSEAGQGTDVYLSFPGVEEDLSKLKVSSINGGKGKKDKNNLKILLAEDNKEVLDTISELLGNEGFKTISLGSDDDILKKALNCGPVDLLITDFLMHQINGPELYERLASINRNIKVIYISGHSGNDIPEKSEIHRFLQKPFSAPKLFNTIEELMFTDESQ